jgi:hypothetical protein
MTIQVGEVETINDLRAWIGEQLPPAKVELDSNGEVIIRTGMTIEMNGVLYPLEWETDDE